MRAATYERLSADKSGRSKSIAQQNRAGRAACAANGWNIVVSHSDTVSASGYTKKKRPGWDAILQEVARRRVDVVVLWEPSRGDRKLTSWSAFLDSCKEHNVKIYITDHERLYDVSSSSDWEALASMGVGNASEVNKLSSRTRRALADLALEGVPVGRIAYGYTRRYDSVTKELIAQEPDSTKAEVVREVIGRIADGDSILSIRNDLHARGIASPSGQEWWPRKTITDMVKNGYVYIGKLKHNGDPLTDGQWPAIVEDGIFWRAKAVLEGRRHSATLPGAAIWNLSYIVRCHCGAPMYVIRRWAPKGRQGEQVYRCSANRAGCMWSPINADANDENEVWKVSGPPYLDDVVAGKLIDYLADPERYAAFTVGDDNEARALRDEAAAEQARLADLESQMVAGNISVQSFARVSAGIEAHIAELVERAQTASCPPAVGSLYSRLSAGAVRRGELLSRWEDMSVAARRALVTEVCAPVVHPDRVEMNWRVVS